MNLELHEENTQLHEERTALLHADREWEILRTVPVGGRDSAFVSGILSKGSDPFNISAKDTRVYLIVQNLSSADYLILSKSPVSTAQNGAAPVTGGVYFAIPPGKTFSIPSRGECFLMAPTDASAAVQFCLADVFD